MTPIYVQLKPECADEVRRVMRQRASSVDLIPEVKSFIKLDFTIFMIDLKKDRFIKIARLKSLASKI